jgi:hypothetical protein
MRCFVVTNVQHKGVSSCFNKKFSPQEIGPSQIPLQLRDRLNFDLGFETL